MIDLTAKSLEGYLVQYGVPTSTPVLKTNSGRRVFEVIDKGALTDSLKEIAAGERSINFDLEHISETAQDEFDKATADLADMEQIKVEDRLLGPYVVVTLDDGNLSNSIRSLVGSQKVKGFSMVFELRDGAEPSYEVLPNGDYLRHLTSINLTGFGLTADPFYPQAEASLRSARQLSGAECAAIESEIKEYQLRSRKTSYWRYVAFDLGVKLD